MITVSEESINRVEKLLAGMPKGAERALANAINRGLSRLKTGASRRVGEVYTVQKSAFNSASNTKISKAGTGNLAGAVTFSGYKIPLYKFNVTPKSSGTGRTVRAAVKKGGGTAFDDAFIANMNGRTGVFERLSTTRFPVKEFMGLSAGQMVGNAEVIEQLELETQKTVEQRLEHEINRLLNGYGG